MWGRFINADAIAGVVGEILGHNVFVYCKNNAINMSDPSGFRPLYISEEETITPSRPMVDNLKQVGNMVISNTTNGGLDKVTSTVASRYIDTGLTYVETGVLTLGTYVEKNPIGSFIKTATGRIGVSSFIGAGVSTVSNIKKYGWTWGAAGRIGIDSIFVVGAVAVTVLVPGVGFAASVAIGVIAESGSRATKNIIYGDKFWD